MIQLFGLAVSAATTVVGVASLVNAVKVYREAHSEQHKEKPKEGHPVAQAQPAKAMAEAAH